MANSLAELGRVNAPRTYNPGRGRSLEQLAYLSPEEMQMLAEMTDGRAEMTPHGLLSFADDSARNFNSGYGGGAQRFGTGTGGSNVTTRQSIPRVQGGHGAQPYDRLGTSYRNEATYSSRDPFGSSGGTIGGTTGGRSTFTKGTNLSSADRLRGGYSDYRQPPGFSSPPRNVEGVAGGKGVQAYDRQDRSYSNNATYTPPAPRGPKQFTDSLPQGGPFAPSAQRPDRPSYERTNPAPTGYQPAPRQGDDSPSMPPQGGSGFATRIAQNTVQAERGFNGGYDLNREQRRIDEKNTPGSIFATEYSDPNTTMGRRISIVRDMISQFGVNGAKSALGVG